MRARHVLSIAFGVFMTASFLKPCETYGFMMGGSGQGKIFHQKCITKCEIICDNNWYESVCHTFKVYRIRFNV